MDQVFITSAAVSNYEGMYALIADDGQVYLGRDSNFYPETSGDAPACYDNSDGSLQLISDNVKMFHFLYGDGWPLSQRQRRRGRRFAYYSEFASLRDGVLSRYQPVKEVTFAGKPFVPPRAYRRMHKDRPAPTR